MEYEYCESFCPFTLLMRCLRRPFWFHPICWNTRFRVTQTFATFFSSIALIDSFFLRVVFHQDPHSAPNLARGGRRNGPAATVKVICISTHQSQLQLSFTYRSRTVPKNEHSSCNLAHQTISAELYNKICLSNTAIAHLLKYSLFFSVAVAIFRILLWANVQ